MGSTTEHCNTGALDLSGDGSCSIRVTTVGDLTISAKYSGNNSYKTSTGSTKLVVNSSCPTLGSITFNDVNSVLNSLQFSISNKNGSGNVTVKEVEVTWVNAPLALLQEIRLGSGL